MSSARFSTAFSRFIESSGLLPHISHRRPSLAFTEAATRAGDEPGTRSCGQGDEEPVGLAGATPVPQSGGQSQMTEWEGWTKGRTEAWRCRGRVG
jgi:hypothetical protein